MNNETQTFNNGIENMTAYAFSFAELGTVERILLVFIIAVLAHISVISIRRLAQRLLSTDAIRHWTKLKTLTGLLTSTLVFTLYFGAFGLVLHEFGVSLTAYLASASILGLAIGFGSQGIVQDVVTGLTVIFSDLFQVGDLVEISGQTGLVQNIGMRFTVLLNPLGAQVYIPNRTLANVIIYPRGYVRCFAVITLTSQQDITQKMLVKINDITQGFVQQFPGILRNKPELGQVETTPSGKVFVRVKFHIWPGRSNPIENAYKQEIVETLKKIDTEYAEWMVSINNEVSEAPIALRPRRLSKKRV